MNAIPAPAVAERKPRFPHSLVLILAMVVIAQISTYFLPAGAFERVLVEGHERVVPGSYHAVESEPLGPFAWLLAIYAGLSKNGAAVIMFVFIVGGVIGVLRATGALDALINSALTAFGHRPVLLVAGMLTLFALGSSTIGMAEEYMPFVPILVTLALGMRMDAVVAMGIVYAGAGIGYGCAALNPFTVVIAQGIAGIEILSGQGVRWLLLLVCIVVSADHILRYARRIQKDPRASLVHDIDYRNGFEMPADVHFTPRRGLVLLACLLALLLMVYGLGSHDVLGLGAQDWYFSELAAVFLGLGVAGALLGGLGPNRAARAFCDGAAEMTSTALLIGFAHGISVVLEQGRVIDTVIHGIARSLEGFGPDGAAVGMLLVQSVTNFFIPSGSGQAYVTMPIMAPLADLTGITRQTAVLAYQFGDGFTNMIIPTNALLMGMLVLARIPYERWLRFVMPLIVKLYLVAVIALLLAVHLGYA